MSDRVDAFRLPRVVALLFSSQKRRYPLQALYEPYDWIWQRIRFTFTALTARELRRVEDVAAKSGAAVFRPAASRAQLRWKRVQGRIGIVGRLRSKDMTRIFGTSCEQLGILPSLGCVGDCFDNAMAGLWFGTLEADLIQEPKFELLPSRTLAA